MNPCLRCGDPVKRWARKFCSPECSTAAQRKPRARCGFCDEPVKRSHGQYCSRACAAKASGERRATLRRKRCKWCQSMFNPRRSMKQAYCTRGCATRARCMTMDDAARKAMYQRATAKANEARRRNMDARWDERTKGLTPGEAARKFYRQGYFTGFAQGRNGRKLPKEYAA